MDFLYEFKELKEFYYIIRNVSKMDHIRPILGTFLNYNVFNIRKSSYFILETKKARSVGSPNNFVQHFVSVFVIFDEEKHGMTI